MTDPRLPLALFLCLCATRVQGQTSNEIQFGRDIQPIFAQHCVTCHGPDTAEGGLDLTNSETVYAVRDSGETPVVPNEVDRSELYRRVTSEDEGERMPPEGKPLSETELARLKSWIEQGGAWEAHWSFVPRKPQTVPEVDDAEWEQSEIDAFVHSRLAAHGLSPASPASDAELMRRAHYDLIGLPPSPDDVRAYLADKDPEKFVRLVERLLDSPHFGERWGRHWLDLVRFAESNSFERDNAKPEAWRYRDYVIRSFNNDKPYDQFVREQLAGDELPDADADALIATGFYRLGLWDDEPADPMQARYDGLDDIVTTIGQVFLGLTVNCARCHDHKIDPISQQDYYGLLAFVHNVTPMGNDGPRILQPVFSSKDARAEYDRQVASLQQQTRDIQAKRHQIEQSLLRKYQRQEQHRGAAPDLDRVTYSFYRDTWDRLPRFDEVKAEETGELPDGYIELTPATREHSFGFVFTALLKVPQAARYRFFLDSDDGARLLIDNRVVATYDGIHGLGSEQTVEVDLAAGSLPLRLEYFQREGGHGLRLAWSGPGFERRPLTFDGDAETSEKIDIKQLVESRGAELLGEDRLEEYHALQRQADELSKTEIPVEHALCVTEYGTEAPETFVFVRGSPHSPGDRVSPQFPALFNADPPQFSAPGPDAKTIGRRKVLADWIVNQDNLLSSRVMANRLWQHLFGRGIVATPNDFGVQGQPPSHPELLDWLADRFVQHGWRIKPMLREMMLSRTYQMSTHASADALRIDPDNLWFSRQNMRRLSAEEIRDSILAVNGTLNRELYGPSVFPKIPAEVMQGQSQPGKGWHTSEPAQQNRRSVYIFVKRSLLVPIVQSFDFAETDFTCPIRFVTTQPTQALGMLNGEFANEQAAVFAAQLRQQAPSELDAEGFVRRALWYVLQRAPSDDEVQRGCRLLESLCDEEHASREQAERLFCLMTLNLNEFVYLD